MLDITDITNLGTGPALMVYAPTTASVVAKLQDVIALVNKEGDYDLTEDWTSFGAAPEGQGSSYSRGFETESLSIEQKSGAVFTDITDVNRAFSLTIAEITPENMRIVENAEAADEAIAAAKNTSAQTMVPIGTVSELAQYRVVLLAQRKTQSGVVKEPDGTERGRLIGVSLNRCSITADDSEVSVEKGNLISAPLKFEAFPEPGVTGKKAYGGWLFEAAGEIKAE